MPVFEYRKKNRDPGTVNPRERHAHILTLFARSRQVLLPSAPLTAIIGVPRSDDVFLHTTSWHARSCKTTASEPNCKHYGNTGTVTKWWMDDPRKTLTFQLSSLEGDWGRGEETKKALKTDPARWMK
jgi:hypothetical protein